MFFVGDEALEAAWNGVLELGVFLCWQQVNVCHMEIFSYLYTIF